MVLLEAGTLPRGRYVSLWGLPELRGVEVTADAVTLGALTTYSEVLAHPVLRCGVSVADAGGGRDRRRRDAEPRHARRQHRERVAGRGHSARAARLRRRARADLGPRIAARAVRSLPHRLQADGPRGRRAHLEPSRFREGGRAGSSPIARSARARRRRSRKSALRPPRRSTAMSCAMPASRSAASRRRSCDACTPKRRSVAGRLRTRWSPRHGRRSPATSPRSTTSARPRAIGCAWRRIS